MQAEANPAPAIPQSLDKEEEYLEDAMNTGFHFAPALDPYEHKSYEGPLLNNAHEEEPLKDVYDEELFDNMHEEHTTNDTIASLEDSLIFSEKNESGSRTDTAGDTSCTVIKEKKCPITLEYGTQTPKAHDPRSRGCQTGNKLTVCRGTNYILEQGRTMLALSRGANTARTASI